MTRHLHIEPVDLVDLLAAEWAQEERAIASHRATRLSARAVFHRLGHTASVTIASLYPAGKCRWDDRQRKGSMVPVLLPRSRGGCGVQGCGDHTLAGVPTTRVVKAFCLAVAVFNVVFWGGQLLRAVVS